MYIPIIILVLITWIVLDRFRRQDERIDDLESKDGHQAYSDRFDDYDPEANYYANHYRDGRYED
jgi:hypothetical protein